DFRWLRADHGGERIADQLVVGHPLRLAGEVAFDRFGCPLVEHFLDMGARAPGLQSERVAAEVGLLAALVAGDQEFVAESAQRIRGIERARVVFGIGLWHGCIVGPCPAASMPRRLASSAPVRYKAGGSRTRGV